MKAREWIAEFAELLGTDVNTLMEGAKEYAERGEYLHMGDNEEYSNHYDKMEEFWEKYELVTGQTVTNKNSFFTCSC
jgi:hypothetical protein